MKIIMQSAVIMVLIFVLSADGKGIYGDNKPDKKETREETHFMGMEIGLTSGFWSSDFDFRANTATEQIKEIDNNLQTQGFFIRKDFFNIYLINLGICGTFQQNSGETIRINTKSVGPEFGLGLLVIDPYWRWGYGIGDMNIGNSHIDVSNSRIKDFTFGIRTYGRVNVSLEYVWRKASFSLSPDNTISSINDTTLGGGGKMVLFNIGYRF